MATEVVCEFISPATPVRRWSAIDVDTEGRIDRELREPLTWRKALMRWLIEYNKY